MLQLALISFISLYFSLFADISNYSTTLLYIMTFCTVLQKIINTFTSPQAAALIPLIVTSEAGIERAYRIKSSLYLFNLIFGTILGGLIISLYGWQYVIAMAAGCYLAAAICTIIFCFRFKEDYQPSKKAKTILPVFSDMYQGFYRVIKIIEERIIGLASLIFNMILTPFIILLLPSKIIGLGMTMFDFSLIELFIGSGVVFAGAFTLKWLRARISNHTLVVQAFVIMGLVIILFSVTDNFYLICILGFVHGMALNIFNVIVNSKRAMAIPAGYRAIMDSCLMFICTLVIPAGLYIARIMLRAFSIDQIIRLSVFLIIIPILTIMFSSKVKLMLNTKKEDIPYYQSRYSHVFN